MADDGVWRTVSGRKIFIKEGQSLSEAMKGSGKFEGAAIKSKESSVKTPETFPHEKYKAALEEAEPTFDTKTMRGTKDGFEVDGKVFDNFDDAKEYMSQNGFEHLETGEGKPGNVPGYNTARYTNKSQVEHYNNVMDARKNLVNDYKEYLNKNFEGTYVRYGDIPVSGKSYNFRDNFFEDGVSTFQAWKVGNKYVINPGGGIFTYLGYSDSGKTLFEVSGNIVGHGSDGEPLLSGAITTKTINQKSVTDIKHQAYSGFKKKK